MTTGGTTMNEKRRTVGMALRAVRDVTIRENALNGPTPTDGTECRPYRRLPSASHFRGPFWIVGFLALLAVALASLGCRNNPPPQVPPPPKVTVSQPLQHEVTDWDEYTGHLQSPETAVVSARVSGFIEQAPIKEGTLVKKGDVLFIIDPRPSKADLDNKRATVAKDEAQLALTKSQLSRYEDLLKKRAISQQDYDTNKAAYQQAAAQLAADTAAADTAQLNVDWTRVTAPISGRVGRMNVTPGNLINGGAGQATQLTTIVSIDPVHCYVPVPERAFLNYQAYAAREKQAGVREAKIPCFVRLENETAFAHEGIIDFIDNTMDPNTGTIQVRGVIPNPDGALTPGLFAQMRITGSGPYKTLLVPEIAVGTEQNERFLLVVGPDDVVASRKVKLGLLFGSLRSIVDGLEPGERVVVNGLQQARPGAKVSPTNTPISPESIRALDAAASGAAAPEGGSATQANAAASTTAGATP